MERKRKKREGGERRKKGESRRVAKNGVTGVTAPVVYY
jgi:hypothetical protein